MVLEAVVLEAAVVLAAVVLAAGAAGVAGAGMGALEEVLLAFTFRICSVSGRICWFMRWGSACSCGAQPQGRRWPCDHAK